MPFHQNLRMCEKSWCMCQSVHMCCNLFPWVLAKMGRKDDVEWTREYVPHVNTVWLSCDKVLLMSMKDDITGGRYAKYEKLARYAWRVSGILIKQSAFRYFSNLSVSGQLAHFDLVLSFKIVHQTFWWRAVSSSTSYFSFDTFIPSISWVPCVLWGSRLLQVDRVSVPRKVFYKTWLENRTSVIRSFNAH